MAKWPVTILLRLLFVAALLPLTAVAQDRDPDRSAPDAETVTWFDGDRARTFRQSPDEVAVVGRAGNPGGLPLQAAAREIFPGGEIVETKGAFVRLRLPGPLTSGELEQARGLARAFSSVGLVSPVFRPGGRAGTERPGYVFSGSMVVQFDAPTDAGTAADWGALQGLELLGATAINDAYLFGCPPDPECVDESNRAYETAGVRYAYPNWFRPRQPRAFVPDDPLYSDQWHLDNSGKSGGTTGEDVNIPGAWLDYDGTGVTIAVVDDGLEIAHPDLSANVVAGKSWDYSGGDTDPTSGDHGTAVAGVAAARGANQEGVSGAAPFASLVGFNVLQASTDTNEADALTREPDLVDISSNSWGPFDAEDFYAGPGPLAEAAIQDGATSGRGGLGTIYTWAGGNGGDDDDANLDGYANSRYTIAVAASDHNGVRSSYSEPGANLHVTAPSSGGGVSITTTDRTGGAGYNGITGNNDYTNIFGGTSSATPLVSGVIALMLEADPSLTWRDVQAVLMTTAERNDPTHADWVQNGAGYWINHYYGFGRVDAAAAVTAAETWMPLGPEASASSPTETPNVPIPADGTPVMDTLTLPDDLRIEYVEVDYGSDHTWWTDMDIVLTSPEGTEAVLQNVTSNVDYLEEPGTWRFGVTRFLGESSAGTWTITVSDNYPFADTGSLLSWGITVYGTAVAVDVSLSIADGAVVEGNSGTVNLPLEVALSAASTATITVDYATADDSAAAGSDFTATSGTLTFNPGDTSKVINVPVIGDTDGELDETFLVNLSNPSNATIADGQAIATIQGDDLPPGCTVVDDELVLDGATVAGSELYEACTSIEARSVLVPNGTDLTLRAGTSVSFQSGFRVETGGSLAVDISMP